MTKDMAKTTKAKANSQYPLHEGGYLQEYEEPGHGGGPEISEKLLCHQTIPEEQNDLVNGFKIMKERQKRANVRHPKRIKSQKLNLWRFQIGSHRSLIVRMMILTLPEITAMSRGRQKPSAETCSQHWEVCAKRIKS